ncbi:ABC transporter ATP-binding protein [Microbacterium paludicola]|uniref:ABC transporter ATP-binding protein n=1 Tax=Microbacterium paludicola TaxID=300019 RepID=UPI0011A31936|nr:ABC transporter ATP-binding protein [Microbacterium paludicola]
MQQTPLLSVDNLVVTPRNDPSLRLVNDVSFQIRPGERVALVGESGSGKSLTCFSVMGLLDPALEVTGGDIVWQGRSTVGMTPAEHRRLLRTELSMVYQEPLTALNPLMNLGRQIREGVPGVRDEDVLRILSEVGMRDPQRVAKAMPHELSGGMRQRAMIAMAMIKQPRLLIADEPTTALDVTIEYQVLKLMYELTHRMNTALLFVTHDLGVVARLADRVLVMYLGEVVEEGETADVLSAPVHPYTKRLLAASSLATARTLVLEEED